MSDSKDKSFTLKEVLIITVGLILFKFCIVYAHCINVTRIKNYVVTKIMSI